MIDFVAQALVTDNSIPAWQAHPKIGPGALWRKLLQPGCLTVQIEV